MENTKTNLSAVSDAEPMIFAPATTVGSSGLTVIRVSGQTLIPVFRALGLPETLYPRRAHLLPIRDAANDRLLDIGLVLYFPAPHSFTGEDVLELQLHGGHAVCQSVFEVFSHLSHCRMAEPGEFSKRAFLNNKMDLLEAEAIADLIHAQTAAQQQQALTQMRGAMSTSIMHLRDRTLRALALLEAYIDFPDEEIPEHVLDDVDALINALIHDIEHILAGARTGEMIRDGIRIAIIGPPNAGKSSLLNALAKRDVAIVTEVAGTTRDRIEIDLNLNGHFVRIIDTAGLRDTDDMIESEGIRRSIESASNADLILAVFDITTIPKLDQATLSHCRDETIYILNKSDQPHPELNEEIKALSPIILSAIQLNGLSELIACIEHHIARLIPRDSPPIITRERHRKALSEALSALTSYNRNNLLELSAEELRLAANYIGKITGKIDVDQLLDVIFKEFCIGK